MQYGDSRSEKNHITSWVNKNIKNNGIYDGDIIANELIRLENYYYYLNDSSSNVSEDSAIHIRRKEDDKIYAHLIIENDKLMIAKSKGHLAMRDSLSQALPYALNGEMIHHSNISDVNDCKVLDKENISNFVEALLSVADFNIDK